MEELSVEALISVAVTIESNGADYYRRGAENAPQPVADELLRLAHEEDKHRQYFQDMKCCLKPEDRVAVPVKMSQSKSDYLRAIVDGKTIVNPTSTIEVDDFTRTYDVLAKAIDDEKDTIVFYQCIKSVVKDDSMKERLDEIIDQEINHMMSLYDRLEMLKG